MERNEFARDSSLIAIGGGIVGDLAGFAAATFLRGINLFHLPTTVTSQVDSAIGGKVGVNFRSTINAIGTYYHPRGIFVDLAFIDGLPHRDFIAGIAEVIKCAIICDSEFFEYLMQHADGILRREEAHLMHIYRRAIEIKLQHVTGDLRDTHKRLRLNYGHTLGHAIELTTAGDEGELYRHGEGVALGMYGASFIADELFGNGSQLSKLHRMILTRYGLPVHINLEQAGFSKEEFIQRCLAHVKKDKKRQAMQVRFILPKAIGEAVIHSEVPHTIVERAVEMLCKRWNA